MLFVIDPILVFSIAAGLVAAFVLGRLDVALADRFGQERVLQCRPAWWWRMLKSTGYVVVGSKVRILWPRDTAALEFVRATADLRQQEAGGLFLRARRQFQEIERSRPVTGLLAALDTYDDEQLCLAIWLLGRSGARGTAPVLAAIAEYSSPRARKEIARALRRLCAWPQLRAMERSETDPLVLSQLRARKRELDPSRLRTCISSPAELVTAPTRSAMPYWMGVLPGRGRSPKSVEVVQLLLERISPKLRPGHVHSS